MGHPGFGPIYSRCDGEWHASIQAVSERLEAWGYSPEGAYRIASAYHNNSDNDKD